MNIFTGISKRKRIEILVTAAIDQTAADDDGISNVDPSITGIVKRFTEVWPRKYFDIGDDRKIAGLVLAYMMEISLIEVEQLNSHGCEMLKFAAEIDLGEFRENSPRTFEQLNRRNLLESRTRT